MPRETAPPVSASPAPLRADTTLAQPEPVQAAAPPSSADVLGGVGFKEYTANMEGGVLGLNPKQKVFAIKKGAKVKVTAAGPENRLTAREVRIQPQK